MRRIDLIVIPAERLLLCFHVQAKPAGNKRCFPLFKMAAESKLRGCDQVRDVFSAGHVKERTALIQSKTGKPVRLEITDVARQWRVSLAQPASPQPASIEP